MDTVTKSKILISILWGIGLVCCFTMKKIQPETVWLYTGYVMLICGGITWFLIWLLRHYELL